MGGLLLILLLAFFPAAILLFAGVHVLRGGFQELRDDYREGRRLLEVERRLGRDSKPGLLNSNLPRKYGYRLRKDLVYHVWVRHSQILILFNFGWEHWHRGQITRRGKNEEDLRWFLEKRPVTPRQSQHS